MFSQQFTKCIKITLTVFAVEWPPFKNPPRRLILIKKNYNKFSIVTLLLNSSITSEVSLWKLDWLTRESNQHIEIKFDWLTRESNQNIEIKLDWLTRESNQNIEIKLDWLTRGSNQNIEI